MPTKKKSLFSYRPPQSPTRQVEQDPTLSSLGDQMQGDPAMEQVRLMTKKNRPPKSGSALALGTTTGY